MSEPLTMDIFQLSTWDDDDDLSTCYYKDKPVLRVGSVKENEWWYAVRVGESIRCYDYVSSREEAKNLAETRWKEFIEDRARWPIQLMKEADQTNSVERANTLRDIANRMTAEIEIDFMGETQWMGL
jgi:hypothetical protein